MNLIVHESEAIKAHTTLKDIFKGINNRQADYMWLIRDIKCNSYPVSLFEKEKVWIDGDMLSAFADKYDVQFIWGVFSAFYKHQRKIVDACPSIRDNYTYDFQKPQHPDAIFEVYCLDSSATAIVSLDESVMLEFKENYPESKVYMKTII